MKPSVLVVMSAHCHFPFSRENIMFTSQSPRRSALAVAILLFSGVFLGIHVQRQSGDFYLQLC